MKGKEETYGDSISGEEAGAIVAIENVVTGEKWDLKEIEARDGPEWDPMAIAGRASSSSLYFVVVELTWSLQQSSYRTTLPSWSNVKTVTMSSKPGLFALPVRHSVSLVVSSVSMN